MGKVDKNPIKTALNDKLKDSFNSGNEWDFKCFRAET